MCIRDSSRAFWAKLLTNIQNVILGALWMAILSGKAWYVTASGSAIKNLICLPFQAILLYTLFLSLIHIFRLSLLMQPSSRITAKVTALPMQATA